jgi:hypothetical protein
VAVASAPGLSFANACTAAGDRNPAVASGQEITIPPLPPSDRLSSKVPTSWNWCGSPRDSWNVGESPMAQWWLAAVLAPAMNWLPARVVMVPALVL